MQFHASKNLKDIMTVFFIRSVGGQSSVSYTTPFPFPAYECIEDSAVFEIK
jgi:hypothetical protein